jgi:hypothetical protein
MRAKDLWILIDREQINFQLIPMKLSNHHGTGGMQSQRLHHTSLGPERLFDKP